MRDTPSPARSNQPTQALRALLIFAVAAALAGCATMDAKDCEHADWAALGRTDALHGRSTSMGAERAKECRKYGDPVNMNAYQTGFRAGLVDFCTPAGGAAFGDKGEYYTRGYCPVGTEAGFLSGYTPAFERYQFREKVRSLRSDIDSRESEIRKLRSQKGKDNSARIDRLDSEIHRLRRQLEDEMMMRAVDR